MGKRSRKKDNPHFRMQKSPVAAKKHLGQHFLKDENIAAKIADALSYKNYDQVVEIGPGTGMLTKYLLSKSQRIIAMEVDAESVAYLQENYESDLKPNLEVLQVDFLKFDLINHLKGQPFAIIGNFPYNISSQIVFKTLEWRSYIPEFAGMFQKEVARRICEGPGSKTYGILSVLTQAYYETEYLFTVPPSVFMPPPKVDSGVIRLIRKKDYQLECDETLFFRVVKTAFNQRRKTLRNSLKAFDLSINLKEDAIFDRRPEELAVSDFIALTEKIEHDTV